MRVFNDAEIQALEIAVKAGLVPPSIPWADALPDVKKFILELAKRLQEANG